MTLVCDLEQFEETSQARLSAPLRQMAAFLHDVVCATTCRPAGEGAILPCRRRSCEGPTLAGPARRGEPIPWICMACADQGEVAGWERTRWDHHHGPPRLRLLTGGRGRCLGDGDDRPLDVEEVTAALATGRRLSLLRWTAAVLDALSTPLTVEEVNAFLTAASPPRRPVALDPRAPSHWPTGRTALVTRSPQGLLRLERSSPRLAAARRAVRTLAGGSASGARPGRGAPRSGRT